jgi:3-oxoacyl-[acyl-carrier-protein] synthase II
MRTRIVITGIGMVTPLGQNPPEILRRIETGQSAAAPPTRFDATPFACPICAEIKDFQPQPSVAGGKMIRLMNRDAQLAVAAAHLALNDAGVKPGGTYAPEEIALYGATGLAGLPLVEVIPLVQASTGPDGRFDPGRFGEASLRAVSPILSFKILSNMPLCFVSICENIQGPNGIYTPWEGQGAQAIEMAIRSLESGDAGCALVGGCDVKTHEFAFLSLEQQGLFASWQQDRAGMAPGEGAIFLVLESADRAIARGARMYAQVSAFSLRTHPLGAILGGLLGLVGAKYLDRQ